MSAPKMSRPSPHRTPRSRLREPLASSWSPIRRRRAERVLVHANRWGGCLLVAFARRAEMAEHQIDLDWINNGAGSERLAPGRQNETACVA